MASIQLSNEFKRDLLTFLEDHDTPPDVEDALDAATTAISKAIRVEGDRVELLSLEPVGDVIEVERAVRDSVTIEPVYRNDAVPADEVEGTVEGAVEAAETARAETAREEFADIATQALGELVGLAQAAAKDTHPDDVGDVKEEIEFSTPQGYTFDLLVYEPLPDSTEETYGFQVKDPDGTIIAGDDGFKKSAHAKRAARSSINNHLRDEKDDDEGDEGPVDYFNTFEVDEDEFSYVMKVRDGDDETDRLYDWEAKDPDGHTFDEDWGYVEMMEARDAAKESIRKHPDYDNDETSSGTRPSGTWRDRHTSDDVEPRAV